jgi:ADP-ribose pyrophosphatase
MSSKEQQPILQFNRNDISIVKKHTRYQGFFALNEYQLRHKLFNGGYSKLLTRELFERGDAVAVLPYDSVTDQIILVEQFRLGALKSDGGPWQLEIIAGMFGENEAPVEVIVREAKEEANLDIADENIEPIMNYLSSSGGASECIHLFFAHVDSSNAAGVFGLEEEGEDILVHALPSHEVFALLKQGKITNAATIIALQWLYINKEKLLKK